MSRLFEICAPYEEERLIKIVIDDFVEAIKKLRESLDKEEYIEYLRERIREVIEPVEQ